MKYIIDVPDSFVDITNGLHIPMDKQGAFRIDTGLKLTPYTEPDEDESYGINRYKAIGLAFLKWLGNDVGDKLKSADDVYRFLDKNCYNKDAVEQEVWEFAKNLISMSGNEVSDMMECATNFGEVMYNMPYQEAKAKYESWKKQKDEIHVGDEVFHNGAIKTVLCIYLGRLTLYDSNGHTYYVVRENENIKKTGRHFPEVSELLKKMKGE